ncbi:MAG TPA: hypothetical protein VGQ59_06455 [Cyclobacteriaceae bacterium]|jgi:hypothetical protein|nr:hypothetical protein [Cyclobacteriaceae bacterium]
MHLTDKEIDLLFKSIENFDEFNKFIALRQNLRLKNKIEVKFDVDSVDNIELHLPNRILTFDKVTFNKIVDELLIEKSIQDNHELLTKNRVTKEQVRNEIFDLGENRYKIHNEYIEDMFFASEIASAHGAYLRKLRDLLRIFNRDNVLVVDEKQISSRGELIDFLKLKGFKYIDKDLK